MIAYATVVVSERAFKEESEPAAIAVAVSLRSCWQTGCEGLRRGIVRRRRLRLGRNTNSSGVWSEESSRERTGMRHRPAAADEQLLDRRSPKGAVDARQQLGGAAPGLHPRVSGGDELTELGEGRSVR